jgi:hypothetical protein
MSIMESVPTQAVSACIVCSRLLNLLKSWNEGCWGSAELKKPLCGFSSADREELLSPFYLHSHSRVDRSNFERVGGQRGTAFCVTDRLRRVLLTLATLDCNLASCSGPVDPFPCTQSVCEDFVMRMTCSAILMTSAAVRAFIVPPVWFECIQLKPRCARPLNMHSLLDLFLRSQLGLSSLHYTCLPCPPVFGCLAIGWQDVCCHCF